MLWRGAKERAKQKGVAFSITIDDVRGVWPDDGRCPVLGFVMKPGRGRVVESSPSLDRLNPAWGYEKGNIAVICHAANRGKAGLSASDHEKIARWMRSRGLE